MTTMPANEKDRLVRLIESGRCKAAEAPKYADQLRRLANEVANAKTVDTQSKLFKALADQTRLRILRLLEMQEMCVCELMVALDLTQPTASHHLGLLENAGLVRRRREVKWVFYSIVDHKLVANLLGTEVFKR
ncbi:MAG TPA: metalloregulator ArsR/SmtB family transcription factor [Candidatus Bathyarchaeia archaeon]|nr:metalloregulator ArsR/SmtB family transcription factor [Candidatus Bathyarchaeia archaeon]